MGTIGKKVFALPQKMSIIALQTFVRNKCAALLSYYIGRRDSMTILLTRGDGSVSRLKNQEYLPAFYLIPEELLCKCGKEIYSIPRNIRRLRADKKAFETIESDVFLQVVKDTFAFMAWPFLTPDARYMEVYSGYDPVWKIAHSANLWIYELIISGLLPESETVLDPNIYSDIPYTTLDGMGIVFSHIVPAAIYRWNLMPVIETVKKYRCFEDFDDRDSHQKIDFHRKWYHTRTKHPQISLETMMEEYEENNNGKEWDIADEKGGFEEHVHSDMKVNAFFELLTEKDAKILKLKMAGYTYEKIAHLLGYKTHSAVQKRIARIRNLYIAFDKEYQAGA